MHKILKNIFLVVLICSAIGVTVMAARAQQAPQTQAYGIAVKKPVLGGACAFCPWGALADIVKSAMKSSGYDVQICYNCSTGEASRIVGRAKIPPERGAAQIANGSPPPPNAPVDFGVTSAEQLRQAYLGEGAYKAPDGPYKNLRLFALIDQPSYLIVAVKKSSGITDLAQIKAKKLPVRIYTSGDPATRILENYGLTEDALKSWGGSIGAPPASAGAVRPPPVVNPGGRPTGAFQDFDVFIHSSSVLANNPESNIWYQVTQKVELNYLQLPDDLLGKLASEFHLQRVELPQAYLAGVERRIPTVGRNGQVVYGRDDAPDDFAYAVAKAMDKNKGLLKWAVLPFSYDPDTVWKDENVPLHPGAARYYREVGYMGI